MPHPSNRSKRIKISSFSGPKITKVFFPENLGVFIEGDSAKGDSSAKDVDYLYGFIYKNKIDHLIAGPTIEFFYSKTKGRYVVFVPFKTSEKELLLDDKIKLGKIISFSGYSINHFGSWDTIDKSFKKILDYLKNKKISWYFPVVEIFHKCLGEEKTFLTQIIIPTEEIRIKKIKE